MPAMRRFLGYVAPVCFGSTKEDSNYERYDKPNRFWAAVPRSSRSRSGFDSTGITKTVDTQVESQSKGEDEVELVTLQGKEERSG